jgi:hypothetical protein
MYGEIFPNVFTVYALAEFHFKSEGLMKLKAPELTTKVSCNFVRYLKFEKLFLQGKEQL